MSCCERPRRWSSLLWLLWWLFVVDVVVVDVVDVSVVCGSGGRRLDRGWVSGRRGAGGWETRTGCLPC